MAEEVIQQSLAVLGGCVYMFLQWLELHTTCYLVHACIFLVTTSCHQTVWCGSVALAWPQWCRSGGLFSLYRSCSFCLHWTNFSAVFISTSVWSNFQWVGSSVRVRRAIRRCTSEVPRPLVCVFLQSSSASNWSYMYLSSGLPDITFTAFSAFALVCG